MLKSNSENISINVCDFSYLIGITGGKERQILEILDTFLIQIPRELQSISNAINRIDYAIIKNFAHSMKSTVSIMGIVALNPILSEMENLGMKATNIEIIIALNKKLILVCKQAIKEVEKEKENYV